MSMNQALEQRDNAESRLHSGEKDQQPFDAGHIWMNLAAGYNKAAQNDRCKDSTCTPGLPDLDLHSGKGNGDKNTLSEQMIDDIEVVVDHNNNRVSVSNDRKTRLSDDKSNGDLPVIKTGELQPGQIGIIINKQPDGTSYYTAFIAGSPEPLPRNGDPGAVAITETAAKELHIDGALKNGRAPKIDIIALPTDSFTPPFPRSSNELTQVVKDKFHVMAEEVRDTEAEQRAKAEAEFAEPPRPDAEFGYRRTERTPEELRKISEDFRNQAREFQKAADPAGIEDRMAAFGKQAQSDIVKYQKEVDKALKDKKPESEVLISKYNLSYAQSELAISKDKTAFTRHMRAEASAAAVMSMNPDMEGALKGHRIVINSGHNPDDPKFPGFEKDGIPEWKLNMESEDVFGAMTKMAGGAVKLINQQDLKDKGMTGLANAIKAAKPEAAIAIHHDDVENPDVPAMRGTLTLHCAKTTGEGSLQLAEAIHMAKVNYAGLDDRVNPKGLSTGIREQCGRGIQGHNVGAPFILDEQLSTHKDEWPQAISPKVNAAIQFAHIVGLYELFNNKPRYKISAEDAQAWKDTVWNKPNDLDDIFTNRPKVGGW